jgi:tetratricopeptide (TPR) repeat protein
MARLRFFFLLALPLLAAGDVGALPPGSSRAREAYALCRLAEQTSADGRVELLTRGIELAEAALAADRNDALAHFALFCNLGRRVQSEGVTFGGALATYRALRAIDTALELAPDDPDVVAAKGVLLLQLPAVLGGDEERGEQCLRRALTIDPNHGSARGYLDEALARRGVAD